LTFQQITPLNRLIFHLPYWLSSPT